MTKQGKSRDRVKRPVASFVNEFGFEGAAGPKSRAAARILDTMAGGDQARLPDKGNLLMAACGWELANDGQRR